MLSREIAITNLLIEFWAIAVSFDDKIRSAFKRSYHKFKSSISLRTFTGIGRCTGQPKASAPTSRRRFYDVKIEYDRE